MLKMNSRKFSNVREMREDIFFFFYEFLNIFFKGKFEVAIKFNEQQVFKFTEKPRPFKKKKCFPFARNTTKKMGNMSSEIGNF